jgi:hypothetical protein
MIFAFRIRNMGLNNDTKKKDDPDKSEKKFFSLFILFYFVYIDLLLCRYQHLATVFLLPPKTLRPPNFPHLSLHGQPHLRFLRLFLQYQPVYHYHPHLDCTLP